MLGGMGVGSSPSSPHAARVAAVALEDVYAPTRLLRQAAGVVTSLVAPLPPESRLLLLVWDFRRLLFLYLLIGCFECSTIHTCCRN
jgi:hypothetical protein